MTAISWRAVVIHHCHPSQQGITGVSNVIGISHDLTPIDGGLVRHDRYFYRRRNHADSSRTAVSDVVAQRVPAGNGGRDERSLAQCLVPATTLRCTFRQCAIRANWALVIHQRYVGQGLVTDVGD